MTKEKSKEEKVVKGISLADLAPEVCIAKVNTRYGRTVEIPFIPLSWEEWDAEGRKVIDPKVPTTKLAEDGITQIPNYQDEMYLKRMDRAAQERIANRMFRMINSIPENNFPGDTPLEQFDNLKRQGDSSLVEGMVRRIYGAGLEGQSEIDMIAASFPPQSPTESDQADLPEAWVEDEAVVAPV